MITMVLIANSQASNVKHFADCCLCYKIESVSKAWTEPIPIDIDHEPARSPSPFPQSTMLSQERLALPTDLPHGLGAHLPFLP